MNKLFITTLALTAVTLLSGCQHVTVRHNHPAPVQVRTVHVEHREVGVHDHHHQSHQRQHEDRRHDHQPPQRVVVTPTPPVRVIPPRPPVRIVSPQHHDEHRHERRPPAPVVAPRQHQKSRRFEIVNLPRGEAPVRRDEERGHRRPEPSRPPIHMPEHMRAPVQRPKAGEVREHQRDSHLPASHVEMKESHRPEHSRPRQHEETPVRRAPQQNQRNDHAPAKVTHAPRSQQVWADARQPAHSTKPGKTSGKSEEGDQQKKTKQHGKRDEHRRGE